MTENKQNENNNKRSPIAKIILAIVIIILLLFLHRCTVYHYEQKVIKETEEFIDEFEENVNAITEIEDAMRQEAIDTAVDEGMMNVNYLAKAVFDGTVSKSFNVKNIENNHDSITFKILDEDNNVLYQSKKIAPGYEINCIELNKELPKGRYECTIQIKYASEGNVTTAFPITLVIE